MSAENGVERSGWGRPTEGRVVSGVCALAARLSGASPRALRAASVLTALAGLTLALAFALFDHAFFEGGASLGVRVPLVALGLALCLHYPLLAFLLPSADANRRWDFGSAIGAILFLVALGQGIGVLCANYWDAAKHAWLERGFPGLFTWPADYAAAVGFGARDLIFGFFLLTGGAFVLVQRKALVRFFRAMHVGATLVVLTTLAITVGVLVPQIDGFEDPDQRVDFARERADYELFREFGYQKLPANLADGHEQYQAFRWAEGYFLYHLLHFYGIGMPSGDLTPQMLEGLERYGQKYGLEERGNTEKQMRAAFSGHEKLEEIGALIHANEPFFWRFFEVSTVLDLNRTYKSHWFAALLWLLGTSIFLSAYKNWRFSFGRLPFGLLGGLVAAGFVSALWACGLLSGPWLDLWPLLTCVVAGGLVLGSGVPRSTLSLQKLGFFVVHNGLLVLLLGGLWSKLLTERSTLNLDLRHAPQRDTFARYWNPEHLARMPFAVRLDYFGRKDWLALEAWFPEEEFRSNPPRYTLWKGRKIELDHVDDGQGGLRPDLEIRVKELYDRVSVGLAHASESTDPEQPGMPIAEVLVRNAGEDPHGAGHDHGQEFREFLAPLVEPVQTMIQSVYRDSRGKFRLAAAHGPAPERLFPTSEGRLGYLEYTVVGEGDGAPRTASIRLGETVELAGGYRARVVDATSDFGPDRADREKSQHPLALAEQPQGLSAVWVDVEGPSGQTERRIVFEEIDPVEHGLQEAYFHQNLVLRLTWDSWTAPGPPRYLLHWGEDEEPSLLAQSGEERQFVALDEPLPLPPGGSSIVPLQLLQRAVFSKNLEFHPPVARPDGWDADFYARDPRGALLEIVRHPGTSAEKVERVELASTDYARSNLWFSQDGHVVLHFLENSEMLPYEWRSVLSIIEEDNAGRPFEVQLGNESQREIRVNDYFYYKGYRFFQTNADAARPTYSGIGVVYDPGIPWVLTGMYAIIAGATIAFLVRPIVRRAKASEATP